MFFGQHNFHYGVLVSHRGNNIWFHASLRILIADEVALKQSIENKGAAGKLFCCRCCNVVSKGSWTPSLADKGFVHGTTTDFSQFRLHTNESVQRIVSHLAEQHDSVHRGVLEARNSFGVQLAARRNPHESSIWSHGA